MECPFVSKSGVRGVCSYLPSTYRYIYIWENARKMHIFVCVFGYMRKYEKGI